MFILLAALVLALPAAAQSDDRNTQGANIDASKLDAAAKARLRTEGAAGGLPGSAKPGMVGNGGKNRTFNTTLKEGKTGEPRSEKSSNRKAGRGATGR